MFPADLPPVSNKPLYAYRVLAKWFSFLFFGAATLTLVIVVFPFMRLFLHPREKFRKYARRFVSASFKFFVFLMHSLGAVDLIVKDKEKFSQLSSKIIVANHPSLLDVVMLISLVPNADCVVNAKLNKNIIVKGVIRQLYILGSLEYDDLLAACAESLKLGNCLIVFPEGTRTPRYGKAIVKKGAARMALVSGFNLVPVHIGGTDKFGLGKKDPWTGFNPNERYVYDVEMGNEISPEKYKGLSMPKAARLLTNDIAAVLFPSKYEGITES